MTVRRNNRPVDNPEALAALLPEHLRNFGTYTDMDKRRNDIAAWINTQLPEHGAALVKTVMDIVGLTYLSDLRDRLRT